MYIDPSSVRLVDAFRIRQTLDPDFSSFHSHSMGINKYYMPKYYIPEGEWWLDHRLKDEKDFFLMLESIERPKHIAPGTMFRMYLAKRLIKSGPVPDFVERREWHLTFRLVIVDGSILRQYVDPEFSQGGHHLVYSYIPKGEVWIEKAVRPKELPSVLNHELVERRYMARGKSYDTAHEYATAAEKDFRRQHGGFYPMEDYYPWSKLTDKQIRERYYVHEYQTT